MSYTPNIWVDREGTTRYFETIDTDGAKIFTPDYSQLTEIGTPVNADHMNHIEEGIAAGSFTKYNSSTTYKQNDLVTFFEDGKLKVYKSLKDENTNNEVANENYWEEVALGGGGSSLPIGSTVVLDKVLSFEESQGLALQGTYVYKTAIAGERYGYPDFYEKYLEAYKNSSNKKAYLKSNVTKVGSVVDNKGVLSDFSSSNYVRTNKTVNFGTANTWEIVTKCKFTTLTGTANNGYMAVLTKFNINSYINTSKQICIELSSNGTSYNIGTLKTLSAAPLNKDFYLKVEFTGSAYNLYYGIDFNNLALQQTITTNTKVGNVTDTFALGVDSGQANQGHWAGSFDLNGCYININGQRVWDGTDKVIQNSNGVCFYPISQKSTIDEIFNSTGVADFYGIDEANERIFLPRNNKFWQFTTNTDEVNDYVEAGLPSLNILTEYGATANNGMKPSDTAPNPMQLATPYSGTQVITNASIINPIYGNSNTVQPPASKKLLYYVVGNTVSDTSWVDVVTQVEGGVKDLEDKTQEGIERLKASSNALTTTQITNCITEIPQDIKLELNEGVLTLKAGSKVYMPNGFEADGTTPKFDEVVVESDKQWNYGTGEFVILISNTGGITGTKLEHIYSGATEPTIVAGVVWYDTTNNIIKRSQTGTDWDEKNYALPISVVTTSSGSVTAIDQTFNGFGYIGSSFYFLPNVKALLRNGKNPDGTLKNIERVVDKIYMYHTSGSGSDENFYLTIRPNVCGGWWAPRVYEQVEEPTVFSYGGALWINTLTNESKYHGESDSDTWVDYPVALVGTFTRTATTGAVKNFTPKQPFRAVDYNDLTSIVPTGTVISSASSATPTGYLYCNGAAVSRTTYADLFSAIGTTYGTGDGSTTFNLPNYSNYNFVTSNTVSVKGTGKSLGLTNGSTNYGLTGTSQNGLWLSSNGYNVNVGTSGQTVVNIGTNAVGVSTDASKSGLNGTVSTAKINWYIKY